MKKGDRVRVTKISDDKFGGLHPNGVDKGYTQTGEVWRDIEVGESAFIGSLLTSEVTEIVSDSIFKTKNSTYMVEVVPNVESSDVKMSKRV